MSNENYEKELYLNDLKKKLENLKGIQKMRIERKDSSLPLNDIYALTYYEATFLIEWIEDLIN